MSQPPSPSAPDAAATIADDAASASPARTLSAAARRALAEAAARRGEIDRKAAAIAAVAETDGRGGTEPVRYGDWEVKGLASDF